MQGSHSHEHINHVLVADQQSKALCFPVYMLKPSHDLDVPTRAFVDSGAGINCLDYGFVKKNRIPHSRLFSPIIVKNVNQSTNTGGTIKISTELFIRTVGNKTFRMFCTFTKMHLYLRK